MTETEFDVLDELYFLTAYQSLVQRVEITEDKLKETLKLLLEKGWIKCYSSPMDEMEFQKMEFERDYLNYHYLATKAGLLAHNSKF